MIDIQSTINDDLLFNRKLQDTSTHLLNRNKKGMHTNYTHTHTQLSEQVYLDINFTE